MRKGVEIAAAVAVVVFAVSMIGLVPPADRVKEHGTANESATEESGIGEPGAADIVDDYYPYPDYYLGFNESCSENSGRPCWIANITGIGSIVIDSGTGQVIKKAVIIHCNYTYNETTPGGEAYYQNMGCDNPLPTCDMEREICRECSSNPECMRKRVARFITGVPEQILTWHGYDVVGTGVGGSFDDLSQKCTVSYNHSSLYVGLLNITECEEKVLSYTDCVGGECKRI